MPPEDAPSGIAAARALHAAGRIDEAAAACRTLLTREPADIDALALLGAIAYRQGDAAEAARRFGEALAIDAGRSRLWVNRGVALAGLGRHEAALAAFERAIELEPGYAEAHNFRGLALRDLEREAAALASFEGALALSPEHAEAHLNRGVLLHEMGRPEAALASLERALALQPEHALAHNNRGTALLALGRRDEALASYERAIRCNLRDPEAYHNKAVALLLLGRLAEGWELYESRWHTGFFAGQRRQFERPQWSGAEDIAGKTVLLHAEQGYGDTIQFCRYAPLVAARGAAVVLEAPPPLALLLHSLDGVAQIVARGDALPEFDCHCPLLSLPRAFGTTLATIPAKIPYLAPSTAATAAWRARTEALPGLRVGLAWAGSAGVPHPQVRARDRRRSIPLAGFAGLADLPGVSFVSLQTGEAAAQARVAAPPLPLCDWTDELGSFADTAALIAALDLVVSVDTAVAHLAGALGKPVWLLNRFDSCWRWLTDRNDSPWYPTLRQFRQPLPGDWASALAELRTALSQLASR